MSAAEDPRDIINQTLRQLSDTQSPRKRKRILNAALNRLPASDRDQAASWIAAWKMTQPTKKMNWERVAVFAVAILFFGVLLGVSIVVPNPTASQSRAFTTVLALMAAAFGAFVPGAISVKIGGKGFLVRAVGATAFFAIVYFLKPR